ncbi:hypothetical protein G7007_14320 [Pseudomonas entomophila]|uniref:hypothetical protein n=1 Tax=Pseudomonas entomophila TaxID=312306 RepID=UPI0015E39A70|nr:hypothetical protein [Pseudomonas entomophila]MBA1194013.1 hypothetical protein [Pseudomonas entomophila]
MIKRLPILAMAAMLGACSGSPASQDGEAPAVPNGGCYQSEWQAETVPVINKRLGPTALEKYDEDHQRLAPGCP